MFQVSIRLGPFFFQKSSNALFESKGSTVRPLHNTLPYVYDSRASVPQSHDTLTHQRPKFKAKETVVERRRRARGRLQSDIFMYLYVSLCIFMYLYVSFSERHRVSSVQVSRKSPPFLGGGKKKTRHFQCECPALASEKALELVYFFRSSKSCGAAQAAPLAASHAGSQSPRSENSTRSPD